MSYYTLDYPSRDTALAIIAAMKNPQSRDWDDIAAMTGLPTGEAYRVAENAYRVYGYRDLSPDALCLWLAERFMTQRPIGQSQALPSPATTKPQPLSYGFNRPR